MIRPVPNSSARPAGPQTTPLTALLICVIHSSMVDFPLLHKTKKQTEPTKGSVCKIQAHSFSAAGHAAFPAVPLCVSDDGSVLLPERYSRFPCGLTPSAPAATGFSRVQGNASPHVFPVLSLCTAVHDRKTIPYFAPMCKLFFHLMPHAPPECKAGRVEATLWDGSFSGG